MNAAGAAYELAVRLTHAKHAVTRALAAWETWTVLAAVLYFGAHFYVWRALALRVVGR